MIDKELGPPLNVPLIGQNFVAYGIHTGKLYRVCLEQATAGLVIHGGHFVEFPRVGKTNWLAVNDGPVNKRRIHDHSLIALEPLEPLESFIITPYEKGLY